MNLNEYQKEALKTAFYPEEYKVIYPALGMAGEAGECADKVKKIIRDTILVKNEKDGSICVSNQQRESIALEIGDVLWYCATLSHDIGISLEEVAQMNVDKLRSRQERDKLQGSGDYR